MKNKKYNIEEEVQKTMDSIDAIQRVKGNPFLFTRLQERLQPEQKEDILTTRKLFPAWQIAMVITLLFINGFALMQAGYFKTETIETAATIDDFADEYALTANDTEEIDYLSWND